MTESNEVLEEFRELFDIIKLCYQCGTCAGGCPVFRQYTKFNPRRIMEKLLLGEYNEQLFDDQQIWYCSMCYTCSTRCPQGIDIGHVITEIKNLAVRLKNAPPGIVAEMEAILETGTTAAISQSILKRREKLELPELPKADLGEIQKLLEVTGVVESLSLLKEESS
ncbi:MAG: 4Fe-4S dicluster domain-containing protein [Candidatus Heimdallarchaeota archaeon]|nr:MAG: 4Fe-4S dicluster domain-containing protein [Candidatus Heimdallarchaeota archaeon]